MTELPDFQGIPVQALDFYDDLEADNSKTFWTAHKSDYDQFVRAPMLALAAQLEDEFGAAKVFRPHRDVRFSADKSPYKTHQGLFVQVTEATGYYFQVGAAGMMSAVGFYHAAPARLALIRKAIDGPDGATLQAIIDGLTGAGWHVGGETVKTVPRGYSAENPRIELLRHKSLTLGQDYGFEPFVHTPEVLSRVREDWRAGRPLVEWIVSHVK